MPENKNIFLHKPQINISYSSTGRMWLVCFCAFACVIQSAFSDNGLSIIPAATALFTAIIVELLLTFKTHGVSKISDGSSAATAMILTLMLPAHIHPIYIALASAFGIAIVKYSFGGLGSNWLNPALGGWLFIKLSWPNAFFEALGNADISIYNLSVTTDISALDNSVTELLNSTVFSITGGVQLPSGYIDLLFYNGQGIIADRGVFFLIITSLLITATAINRGWVPLVFLTVYGFLIRFAGDVSGIYWNGDLLYGFFSGGTLLTAFILTAEPATSAKLKSGVAITIILTAILTWFFRYKCGEVYGAFFAVAIINCFTPLIKLAEDKIFLYRSRSDFKENVL